MRADSGGGGGVAPSRGDASNVLADVRKERLRFNSFELFSDWLDRLASYLERNGLDDSLRQQISSLLFKSTSDLSGQFPPVAGQLSGLPGQWRFDVEASIPQVVEEMRRYAKGTEIPLVSNASLLPSFRRRLADTISHLSDVLAGQYRSAEDLSNAASLLHFYAGKILDDLADLRRPELPPGWQGDAPTKPLATVAELSEYAQRAYQLAVRWADAIHDGQAKLNDHRAAVSHKANSIVDNILAWCSWKNVAPREWLVDPPKDPRRRLEAWLQRLDAMASGQSVSPGALTEIEGPDRSLRKDGPTTETNSKPFSGGEIVFYLDRVELCGVSICSGPRSKTKRRVLELLCKQGSGGTFEAFSGEQLAKLLELKGGENGAAGVIRDLRADIAKCLGGEEDIACGRQDVILSRGPGYRLSKNLTVRYDKEPKITDITVTNERLGGGNVGDPNASDVGGLDGESAVRRQEWIVGHLAKGQKLRAQTIAGHFGCSLRTAERDLTTLKERGQIKFVGSARTGSYRLSQNPPNDKSSS